MQSQGLQLVLLVLAHFQDNEWWKITEHLTHLTASCPMQTDFRMPVHRYQNEIARLITMRNTASVKNSYGR